MTKKEIEKFLKLNLGETYGGPSLSYSNNKFILYDWGDAPVSINVLSEGSTLDELILNYLFYKNIHR